MAESITEAKRDKSSLQEICVQIDKYVCEKYRIVFHIMELTYEADALNDKLREDRDRDRDRDHEIESGNDPNEVAREEVREREEKEKERVIKGIISKKIYLPTLDDFQFVKPIAKGISTNLFIFIPKFSK